jgi:hypothetical protein
MFTSTAKLFLSEAIAQNRYLPIGYKLWYLYGEWDRNPPLPYELIVCRPRHSELRYTIPPTGKRCFNWGSWLDMRVTEMDPSCMSVTR